ncbi:MAG: tripartite tricarboxylate transporter permease [Euryarchaeota archaeon]|nr:tripartite tricarboxylate transporter permease [Euryarchaeota archaeon]
MQIETVLLVIDISLLGAALGAFTGITPGIHVNTLAMGVLMAYPLLGSLIGSLLGTIGIDPGLAPLLLACLLISASVVHSFLDFIPSVFFGAPEESESLSVLPGHRLLLSGRGMDAISCAAGGSLIGAMAAIFASLPLILAMAMFPDMVDRIDPFIPGLLLSATSLLLMSQRDLKEAEWYIRVRRTSFGRIVLAGQPVPVDGRDVALTGMVQKRGLGRVITTHTGEWRLKGYHGQADLQVTVEGVWKIRRARWRSKAFALLAFLLSGWIGFAVMEGRPFGAELFAGFDGNLLFPMLTGLFAIPSLIESSSGAGIPEQEIEPRTDADMSSSLKGVGAGLFAAWVPGVTSTAGTVLGMSVGAGREEDTDTSTERFISMSASVGTAAPVFGIAALTMTGSGGTGVLVAIDDMMTGTDMSSDAGVRMGVVALFLLSALVASVLGYMLTMWCGKLLASKLSNTDPSSSSKAIFVFEVVLVLMLTGIPGLLVLAASTVVGMLPPAVGVSRVSLTGCLIFPLLLSYSGGDLIISALLGGA